MSGPVTVAELVPGVVADLARRQGPLDGLPPVVRDAVARAADPDFSRWRAQVARLGGCASPIHLVGESATVRPDSGELLRFYSTEGEPGGRLLVACGNRRSSRCVPCSETYRADTFHLIRAGLLGGKGVPSSVRAHPRVFATFTAPSFGPVHHRLVGVSGRALPCHPRGRVRCGRRHAEDDPVIGTPLDPGSYDYVGAVLWNALAPALWSAFTRELRRVLASLLGVPQTRLGEMARLSFAKVAEYQARGLVHFHAVIRLDGPDPHTITAPPVGSVGLLEQAIRLAASRAVVRDERAADALGEVEVRWGSQVDVRPILAGGDDDALSDEAVAAYIAKYATKGAEASGAADLPLLCKPCQGTGIREHPDAGDCRVCEGTGMVVPLGALRVSEHARRMIGTCWRLGALPALAGLRLRKWAHMLGFRGHFSTKARRYSTTLGKLRGARVEYRESQAHDRLGLAGEVIERRTPANQDQPCDDASVLVLAHWRYAGHGYTPGQALYAESIRDQQTRNREISRRMAREGDPDE